MELVGNNSSLPPSVNDVISMLRQEGIWRSIGYPDTISGLIREACEQWPGIAEHAFPDACYYGSAPTREVAAWHVHLLFDVAPVATAYVIRMASQDTEIPVRQAAAYSAARIAASQVVEQRGDRFL